MYGVSHTPINLRIVTKKTTYTGGPLNVSKKLIYFYVENPKYPTGTP